MQYYSGDWKLGVRTQSNMAEFSSNPDGRLKSEVSYAEHQKRKKDEDEQKMKKMVKINRIRHSKKLDAFINQDEFEEVIDNCNLNGDKLFEFLINYKKD